MTNIIERYEEYLNTHFSGSVPEGIARALLNALKAARSYKSLPQEMVWQDYYSPDDVIKIRAELEAENERLRSGLEALIEQWRYKGEFGWGPWQEGYGPDPEGWVLDNAAAALVAILGRETA